MKTVLITFDYELFLGSRSGKADECMIGPTSRLLALLQDYGFKAVFFVDTVYLMRLGEIAHQYKDASRDLENILAQLSEMVQKGHAIFPHIHAHWLDAVYLPDKNEWSLENMRYYQFSALPGEQQQLLFDRSVQIIQSAAGYGGGDYRVDAYRAGGWSIQPFASFKPFFTRYGIKHEFSVIPGKYHFSNAHSFDFREAPIDRPVYTFSDDVCKRSQPGEFREWTISTLSMTPLERWLNFKVSGLIKRMGKKEGLKGSTVSSQIVDEGDLYRGKNSGRVVASFEGLNPFTLRKYLSIIKKTDYFHFISHPKLITGQEFKMIRILFKKLKKTGKIETDFRKAII